MDVTLSASQPLRDDVDFLRDAFADPDLVVTGDVGLYEQKGMGEIDWTLVVQLLEKGAITGVGGYSAQLAMKQAWKRLSVALTKVRRRAEDEHRRANLAVEVFTDRGLFTFHLPPDPREVGDAVEAITDHVAVGGEPGARWWVDRKWIADDF